MAHYRTSGRPCFVCSASFMFASGHVISLNDLIRSSLLMSWTEIFVVLFKIIYRVFFIVRRAPGPRGVNVPLRLMRGARAVLGG